MIQIDFKKLQGLVPAIIQDTQTNVVYMLGFMNEEALSKTRETGIVYFWSRSKKRIWMKGEISGNILKIQNIYIDCDNDTLLISVKLIGTSACHTGRITCFNDELAITKLLL